MPVYRWWRGEPIARVLASERIVLANANLVLARFSLPPMRCLADLLEADETIIAASEEFEQYPGRTGARYWGAVANLDKGVPPEWPIVGAKRVFAYLKPHFRDFEKVLKALRAIDAAVVIHAPGVSADMVRTHTAANIAFSADPIRMADVRRECQVAICHAGASTVESLVTAGKPLLLLPQQLEQMMTGKRVASIGAGLVVGIVGVLDGRLRPHAAAAARRAGVYGSGAGGGGPARRRRTGGPNPTYRRPMRGVVRRRKDGLTQVLDGSCERRAAQ